MHVGDAHDEVVVDRYDSWRCNARLLQVGEETTWGSSAAGGSGGGNLGARAFSPPPVLAGDARAGQAAATAPRTRDPAAPLPRHAIRGPEL